jgi:phage replication-related protein YjqB (UPF0714/DUF867 family)
MSDKYASFKALSEHETEGTDFRRRCGDRKSRVAVIAPHGGKIEPGTSEIAIAVAGDDFSLSLFEGTKRDDNFVDLHITATNFDEPACLALIKNCDAIVAVHGLAGEVPHTDVGGLDHALRDLICARLRLAGFSAEAVGSGTHAAIDPRNICNRGRQGKGIQLEITWEQRRLLKGDILKRYVEAIRAAIAVGQ